MSTIVPDPTYGLNVEPATAKALTQFARRRRSLLVLRAFAAGLVATFVMLVIVVACDYFLFLSDSVRWTLSCIGYASVFAVMWWQGLGRLSSVSAQTLARQLEAAEPRLRQDLLSAIELGDPELENGSEGFRQRLQRRVGNRIAVIDIGRVLPFGLVQRPLILSVTVLIVCACLSLMPNIQFGRRVARAMLPGIAIQRASLTELRIIAPNPATGYVAEGDAVAIIVELGGAPAESVMLLWRTEDGSIGETEMTPRVAPSGSDNEQRGNTLDYQHHFAANVSIGSVPIHYQVRAGDAISLWETLTPLPRPRAAGFTKTYRLPAYTKLPERVEEAEHGDLKALVGTIADVTVSFDQPVENAVLRYANHGVEVPMQPIEGSETSFVTSITIKTPGQYQVDAQSKRSGLSNPFSPQYAIDPVIDAPPVVEFVDQPNSTIVSPLDVVSLAATASDDLPMDMIVQEFVVNSNAMLQREIEVEGGKRELQAEWDWDLVNRLDGTKTLEKLKPGDILRTRAVGVDRRGNRGESRWIEFLITSEGFDADRHQRLLHMSDFTANVSSWALGAKDLSKELTTISKKGASLDFEAFSKRAEEICKTSPQLLEEVGDLLDSSPTIQQSSTLELTGRAIGKLDQDLSRFFARWSKMRELDDADWKKTRDKVRRDLAAVARDAENQANRIDSLVRSAFGLEFTVGVVGDGISLSESIEPLVADDAKIPESRLPRYVVVAMGRLEAITQMMFDHESSLPESSRRHFGSWQRWSNTWTTRMSDMVDEFRSGELPGSLKQFHGDLKNQVNHSLVDNQIGQQLKNMTREVMNHIGPEADQIRRLPAIGDAVNRAAASAEREDDAKDAANAHRDHKLASDDWQRAVTLLLARIEEHETLHRRRPVVDLQFASDLNLVHRALENVTSEGYTPYKDEPPAQVFQKIANAIQMIEADHQAERLLKEVQALLALERRLEGAATSKIAHAWWLERWQTEMDWPLRYLKNLNLPWEDVGPLDRVRYSQDYNDAIKRIGQRRWSDKAFLTADGPLTALESEFATRLAVFEPKVEEAREVIRSYVLSLPEQARKAAEKAEEAKQEVDERPDAKDETVQSLEQQQSEAQEAALDTIESLVDLANTADITDREQRELSLDADIAASRIQEAVEQAEEKMSDAAATEDKAQRDEHLDQASESLQDLADTLRETADHFEKAEQGEDLSESRQAMRDQEDIPNIDDLMQRNDDATDLADQAQQDAQDALAELERELQSNQPMQQELSDIAQRAAEAAQRTLEQAATDENSLNQSLERSDPKFQEQKRLVGQQLRNLAKKSNALDQAMMKGIERNLASPHHPEASAFLDSARKDLSEATQAANQIDPENSLLSQMQQASQEMSEAVEKAADAMRKVQQLSNNSADDEVHRNDAARNRARDQSKQVERNARDQMVRAEDTNKRDWAAIERDAINRLRRAEREKRDADNALKRAENLLAEDRNKNDENLKRQVENQRQRSQQAERAAKAAQSTREFARDKSKQSEQRKQQIQKQSLPNPNGKHPAAEVASRMAERTAESLDQLAQDLDEVRQQAGFQDQLQASEQDTERLAQTQQRIGEDVAEAAEQLERAARHEERLGREELASQLAQAAEMVAESAMKATQEAQQSLENAASDSAQSPQASQDVAEANQSIADAAQQLAQLVAGQMQDAAEQMAQQTAQSQASPSEVAEGQQKAQTLDELDRALSQQPSGQSDQQSESGQQNQTGQDSQEGNQPQGDPAQGEQSSQQESGQPNPSQQSAAQASQTLSNALNQQSQQSARQRQQQFGQQEPGQQNESSEQSSESASANQRSGSGDMPDGGKVDTRGISRDGLEWGQLRERRTEDATESRKDAVPPQYRREIEAYFRAVAKRASEKSK